MPLAACFYGAISNEPAITDKTKYFRINFAQKDFEVAWPLDPQRDDGQNGYNLTAAYIKYPLD